MTVPRELASFIVNSTFEDLSVDALKQLKIRVLDSLGCALGAIEGRPMQLLKGQMKDFGAGSTAPS